MQNKLTEKTSVDDSSRSDGSEPGHAPGRTSRKTRIPSISARQNRVLEQYPKPVTLPVPPWEKEDE